MEGYVGLDVRMWICMLQAGKVFLGTMFAIMRREGISERTLPKHHGLRTDEAHLHEPLTLRMNSTV